MEFPQYIEWRRTLSEEELQIVIMNHDNFGLLTTWIGKIWGSHSGVTDDSCPPGCDAFLLALPSGSCPCKGSLCLILFDPEGGGTTIQETSVITLPTTQSHIPEDWNLLHLLGLSPNKNVMIFLFTSPISRMTLHNIIHFRSQWMLGKGDYLVLS